VEGDGEVRVMTRGFGDLVAKVVMQVLVRCWSDGDVVVVKSSREERNFGKSNIGDSDNTEDGGKIVGGDIRACGGIGTSLNPPWSELELHLSGDEFLRVRMDMGNKEVTKQDLVAKVVIEVLGRLLGDMVVMSWRFRIKDILGFRISVRIKEQDMPSAVALPAMFSSMKPMVEFMINNVEIPMKSCQSGGFPYKLVHDKCYSFRSTEFEFNNINPQESRLIKTIIHHEQLSIVVLL
ncbi:hypothetical protein Tco_0507848, partial [Tanacetum coccineum]